MGLMVAVSEVLLRRKVEFESKSRFEKEVFGDGDPRTVDRLLEGNDMAEGLENSAFNGSSKPETRKLPNSSNNNRIGHEHESIAWTRLPNAGEVPKFIQKFRMPGA